MKAFIEVNSDTLISVIEKWIETEYDIRKKRHEAYIADAMSEKVGVFRKRYRTRDEAIEKCRERYWAFDLGDPDWNSDWKDNAERLLVLAWNSTTVQVSDKLVYLWNHESKQ